MIFDKDAVNDEQDTISVSGTMAYFKALGVSLEDASMLVCNLFECPKVMKQSPPPHWYLPSNIDFANLQVPMEIVHAPTVGEISKQGFIDGWKAVG